MSKTLLNGVNEVLKRVSVINSNSELGSLTESGKQVWIDIAIQVWNEAIDELYATMGTMKPQALATQQITLTTGAGSNVYALTNDIVELIWPFKCIAKNNILTQYPGGWEGLWRDQIDNSDFTGQPRYAAIYPYNASGLFSIVIDTFPTSEEVGDIYAYAYKRELVLTDATDTMPFNDTVFRAMVPAVAELWSKEQKKDFDADVFSVSIGRAARLARGIPQRTSWIKTGSGPNVTDPMEPGSAA